MRYFKAVIQMIRLMTRPSLVDFLYIWPGMIHKLFPTEKRLIFFCSVLFVVNMP